MAQEKVSFEICRMAMLMPKKFTDEEKSRAVRMVHEQRSEYPTLCATCEAVGADSTGRRSTACVQQV